MPSQGSGLWLIAGLGCVLLGGIQLLGGSQAPQEAVLYENGGTAPIGTAGNSYDDGYQDSSKYVYDPSELMPTNENSLPTNEGDVPPVPHWHACRFAAKAGGVYDLRPMMRLAKTLEDDWVHKDAVAGGTTYYLNICANTMAVPDECRALQKQDPSPAFQVSSNGHCYYLGTLKTFKWKPIDTRVPGKGLYLAYQNGERCGSGIRRQVKYTISCSENFDYDDGPMVVYESRQGCHYDVHWPNKAGCPTNSIIHQLENGFTVGQPSSILLIALFILVAYVCCGCLYKRKFEGAEGLEACPQYELWCAIPGICSGLVDKISGANASRAGFERVPSNAPSYTASSTYGGTGVGGGIKDDMF